MADADGVVPPSPASVWTQVFGEAFASPGNRRRNRKLHSFTPEKTHLSDASSEWLERHQCKAQNKLEKKQALKRLPKAVDKITTETAADPPQSLIASGANRMPLHAERGMEPQVLAFELDVLAERYRESLWDRTECISARPGLIEAFRRLRERFLLCALSRAPTADASNLLAALHDRGLTFDFAFALPTATSGRCGGTGTAPLADSEAMRMLRDEMGMTAASMERRLLAVLIIELDGAEIEARLPASPSKGEMLAAVARSPRGSCTPRVPPSRWPTAPAEDEENVPPASPTDAYLPSSSACAPYTLLLGSSCTHRPHVRIWLPGVTTLLVPHTRLQVRHPPPPSTGTNP